MCSWVVCKTESTAVNVLLLLLLLLLYSYCTTVLLLQQLNCYLYCVSDPIWLQFCFRNIKNTQTWYWCSGMWLVWFLPQRASRNIATFVLFSSWHWFLSICGDDILERFWFNQRLHVNIYYKSYAWYMLIFKIGCIFCAGLWRNSQIYSEPDHWIGENCEKYIYEDFRF